MKIITPRRIIIEGFKSFSARVEIDLSTEASMVLVAGDNRHEPRLGANDCGKSTILQAMEFCLYGSPVRGLRIGDLVSWGGKRASVECLYDVDGVEHVILRSGPPERLYVDGGQAEQEAVHRLLGLTRRQYLNSVVYGQAAPLFVDLPIPERGDLLDEVLDLQAWMRAASVAGRRAEGVSGRLDRLRVEVGRAEGALSALEPEEVVAARVSSWEAGRDSRLSVLAEAAEGRRRDIEVLNIPSLDETAWEQRREATVASIEAELREAEAGLRLARRRASPEERQWSVERDVRLGVLRDSIARIEEELRSSQLSTSRPDVDVPVEAARVARDLVAELGASIAAEDRECDGLRRSIEFFERTGECPECGQEIAAEHADRHLAELRARDEDIAARQAKLASRREVARHDLEVAEDALREVREAARAWDREQDAREARVTAARREVASLRVQEDREATAPNPHSLARLERTAALEREIAMLASRCEAAASGENPHVALRLERRAAARHDLDELIDQAEVVRGEVNPHIAAMERVASERARLGTVLEQLGRREAHLRNMLAQLDFWRGSGFRRARLFCMRRALGQLDLDTMNQAQSMGLVGWRIGYSTETETKSGTQKLGVQVQVQSPTAGAPFGALGGGVGQRVRLCCALGVGSLIQRWCGVRWRFEAFDEPTNFLSECGIEDLLELLRERAERTDRTIYVMDHRGLQHSGFDRVMTVVKDERGSRV